MDQFDRDLLTGVKVLVNDAIVFLDDGAAECLHWRNGAKFLWEAGALDIRDIKNKKVSKYTVGF